MGNPLQVDPTVRGTPSPRVKKDADYVFYELTRSICPNCRKVIDAQIILRDNKVYMRKRCLEWSAFRAALAHVNFVVAQNDLCIDDLATVRADAARELVKDVVGVFLDSGRGGPAYGWINLERISHGRTTPYTSLASRSCRTYRPFR